MSDRSKLLECLSAADFACYEARLFLDTHPCDAVALAAAREYWARAAALREEYERCYGSLTGAPCDAERWTWVDDPWPWDCNFA